MKWADLIRLFALAALWGASFLFMRIGAPALGPMLLIGLRVSIAGIVLVLYALLRRQQVRILHKWKSYLVLGAVNAAIPFSLIATAELHLSASLASILNATTPLFTALVAWGWTKEPFTMKKFAGLLLGIVGVTVLVGWNSADSGVGRLVFVGCSLVAAFFYGIAGVFSAKYFKGEKSLDMAIGQQLAAGVILLPFAVSMLPSRFPSTEVIVSVLGLAVLCTALGYLLYFALIQNVGAVKTLSVTFLIPVFGIVWGEIFLGESVTAGVVVGLLLIFLSIALVVNIPLLRRSRTSTRESS